MSKEQLPSGISTAARILSNGSRPSIRAGILSVLLSLHAFAFAAGVGAADIREIELIDGSVITGEIISLSGGIYTVRSTALGTLRIEAPKIRVIRLKGSAAAGDARGQLKSLEDRMLSDSEVMDAIRALQNDPDLQKVLQDPEILKAVKDGDITALMRNPGFMKLLDKKAVQDINKKLSR